MTGRQGKAQGGYFSRSRLGWTGQMRARPSHPDRLDGWEGMEYREELAWLASRHLSACAPPCYDPAGPIAGRLEPSTCHWPKELPRAPSHRRASRPPAPAPPPTPYEGPTGIGTCDLCDRDGDSAWVTTTDERRLLLCVPCIERFTSR